MDSVERISFTGDPDLDSVLTRRNDLRRIIDEAGRAGARELLFVASDEFLVCESAVLARRAWLDSRG